MAVLIVFVYVAVDQGFKANLLRASDDDLRAIGKAYATAIPRSRGEHEAEEMIGDRTIASDAEDRFLLQRGSGHRLAGNLPAMAPRAGVFHIPYLQSRKFSGADSGHEILGRGKFIAPGLYAFVGRDTFGIRQSEHRIVLIFAWVLDAGIVLAGLSGLWLSQRFLRRVDAITDTCYAIMAGRLSDRIRTKGAGGELERLATTVNGMLDRIQALMESLRQVSNDIAHDMRTPLTHLRASLEKAHARARSTQDYAVAVEQAIGEADYLLNMFAALLRIARIEAAGRRETFCDIDLGELLHYACELYAPQLEDAGHMFGFSVDGAVPVMGDWQMLLQLVTNLLDNALHHTPTGTAVTAWAGIEGGAPTLVIADNGPGIPEPDRDRVFRRFFRGERSRTTPGSGLGLSLVAAIAELHGASIELQDNGPGIRMLVRFPGIDVREGTRPLRSPKAQRPHMASTNIDFL